MKRLFLFSLLLTCAFASDAQTKLTAEQLWKFGRVTGLGISKDDQYLIYSVTTPDVAANKSTRKLYLIATSGGGICGDPEPG
jgi:hypothetical protein